MRRVSAAFVEASMSLRPTPCGDVPAETAAVARAAFPQGNVYLRLRDTLGTIFTDAQFAPLFASRGQPAASPWRLALVTLLQFAEDLSDRRAAEAVRSRIDWKYLLGLELTDPGFDASVLSEFRGRLVAGGVEQHLLDTLLTLCRAHQLLRARGRQRTDSTHVLGAVRALNRLECAIETLRAALNALASAAPDWLRAHAAPDWVERYARRADEAHVPSGEAARRAYAEQVGRDGHHLLAAVTAPAAPAWLRAIPAVELLRRVWVQTFCLLPAAAVPETGALGPAEPQVRWRTESEGFPAALRLIGSPYDPDMRYAKKRSTTWTGYKVHLTETCDDDGPHLITHVETMPAPVDDREALAGLHGALAAKGLLPATHLVDAGYIGAHELVASRRDHDVTLFGPPPKDHHWQAEAGFALRDFRLDWERAIATCPAGHPSRRWTPGHHQGHTVVKVRFSARDCRPCALKARCTHAERRELMLRPREEHEALAAARAREAEAAFADEYHRRAGIEGTLSAGVRALHLRRARYIGLAKTHLQHVVTAAAMNLVRLGAWLGGTPLARTRQSAFLRLMAQPACA
jgi:transposase